MDELIQAKAKELFFSYGFRSISMDELAKKTGISKKTIYQFYSDKNELINKVVDDLMQSHYQLLNECLGRAHDAVEEVLLQSEGPFNTLASVNQTFFFELHKSIPQAWTKLEQHKQKVLLPGIMKNLERGIQENLYRANMDVAFTVDVRLQQLSTALQSSAFSNRRIEVRHLMNELTLFYLHGITTEKGKKLLYKYLKNRNENRSTK